MNSSHSSPPVVGAVIVLPPLVGSSVVAVSLLELVSGPQAAIRHALAASVITKFRIFASLRERYRGGRRGVHPAAEALARGRGLVP
ncbi:hypothetical protein [Nannocystis pusilla]|uniref:hypothetical protein n=1 Tax=Nannocystis pusilla TaxID=889268 RepID=UPI003BF3CF66